ncbi:ATP synthase subunit I [Paraburkholderia sp. LEh10]|uniref:ATP synthase subunit I n=1 Tax=Paraburkholderia sp. LEh10 TaxID=2821353 RepID=UPI001AE7EE6A|nr:ATP synthase subunit I [Paraburkholderia sp. LEh10]MBP0593420.1 ATP synthase subunit I [Paraburkholderia sp. LEh10]
MTSTVFAHLHSALALFVTGLAVGLLVGAVHFVSLRRNAALLVAGRPAGALLLQLSRFSLTAVVFVVLAKAGVLALLGGTGGFMWTRSIALTLGRVEP